MVKTRDGHRRAVGVGVARQPDIDRGALGIKARHAPAQALQVRQADVGQQALPVGDDQVRIGPVDGSAVYTTSLSSPGKGRRVGAIQHRRLTGVAAEDNGRPCHP